MRLETRTERQGGGREKIVYWNLFGERSNNFTGTQWTAVPPRRHFHQDTQTALSRPNMPHCVSLFKLWKPWCGIKPYLLKLSERLLKCGAGQLNTIPRTSQGSPWSFVGWHTVCCSIVPGRIMGKEGRDRERRKAVSTVSHKWKPTGLLSI